MQVNREERIAKAKGLGILALIAAVAVTVHVWPRAVHSPAPSPDVTLSARVTGALNPAAAGDPRKPQAPPRRVARVSTLAPPMPVAAVPAATQPPDGVAVVDGLSRLPGSTVALAGARPAVSESRPGAVTQSARSVGNGLARAFQKTGAAFRRAF